MIRQNITIAVSLWLTLLLFLQPQMLLQPVKASESFDLEAAIAHAIEADPLLAQLRSEESAMRAQAIAAGALPDPQLSFNVANLPTDSFSLSQEPMTQVSLGYSQRFPGGDERRLQKAHLERMGQVSAVEQLARQATIRRAVTELWIDAALADSSAELVRESRTLFEQMRAVINRRYNAATRRVGQQDVIQADIEISRIEERLLQIGESKARAVGQLQQWVSPEQLSAAIFLMPAMSGPDELTPALAHPEVRAQDEKVVAARYQFDLAEAELSPDWRITTTYGHRDEDFTGRQLPDFFSVGVSIDLPLFRAQRQDRHIEAAAYRMTASESARLFTVRRLTAAGTENLAALEQLDQRRALYEEKLLGQMAALSAAALDAYRSEEGDFAEVIDAHVRELNTRIEAIAVEAKRQKVIAALRYLAAAVPELRERQE